MKCFYHPERDAVAQCNECKKGLCQECAQKWSPPHCDGCGVSIQQIASARLKTLKTAFVGGFIVGIFYAIAQCVMLIQNGADLGTGIISVLISILACPICGYCLAGWFVGWEKLSNFTSHFFLFLPIIGWLIYFGIKLTLAYFIGLFVLPFEYIKLKNIVNN